VCAARTGSGLSAPSGAASPAHSVERELAELREGAGRGGASRGADALPPSAWLMRETRYRQDLEKFEATVGLQRARIAKLERDIRALREGASIASLEQRIEVRRGRGGRGQKGRRTRERTGAARSSCHTC
jgi:hypothetical protein